MELFLLCLKIFIVRIIDVSLGTVRTLITVKGKNFLAAMVGFFEVFVWFLVVREAINTDSNSIFIVIAYSGGFATGTFLGGILSDKLIKGNLSVQVITSNKDKKMIDTIRKEGYAVSIMNIKGLDEEKDKYMLFIEINKKRLGHLKEIIKKLDQKAFIVVNETKYVQNGYIK